MHEEILGAASLNHFVCKKSESLENDLVWISYSGKSAVLILKISSTAVNVYIWASQRREVLTFLAFLEPELRVTGPRLQTGV